MDFDSAQSAQLLIAMLVAAFLFILSYNLPERIVVGLLILLIPFQLIMSRYGSLNMVFTYVVGLALVLKGSVRIFPFMAVVVAIAGIYLLSLLNSPPGAWVDQIFYLISIASNFVLFYLVYNHFFRFPNYRYAMELLVRMNVLFVIYGFIQITIGFEQFAVFGITEWELEQNLETKQRLVGAFRTPGVNGEYIAMQILLLGFLLIQKESVRRKLFLTGLLLANFGLLVASGSRGSFLVLLGGLALFLLFFRRELGVVKLVTNFLAGLCLMGVVAAAVVNYTEFNVLFERLQETELEGVVPDTRIESFRMVMEHIPDAVLLGHGPRLRLIGDGTGDRYVRDRKVVPYPHNLYLFLLFTVGVAGLTASMLFFALLARRLFKASRVRGRGVDPLLRGLPKLGLLLLIVFLVDQLKIEFLRAELGDMQHYLFASWAIFLALADGLRSEKAMARVRSYSPAFANR